MFYESVKVNLIMGPQLMVTRIQLIDNGNYLGNSQPSKMDSDRKYFVEVARFARSRKKFFSNGNWKFGLTTSNRQY